MPKTTSRHKQRSDGASGRSKQKLFQCTGFGDCNMVFTRSEHLARHARKHTGEKPFKCVVEGCDRMFSRFDNMMQHTQTHSHDRTTKKNREKFTDEVSPSERKQPSRSGPPPPLQTTMLTPPHTHERLPSSKENTVVNSWHSLPELPISPVSPTYNSWSAAPGTKPVSFYHCSPTSQHSPASLVRSASPASSVPSMDEPLSPSPTPNTKPDRRLSVAEICNPVNKTPTVERAMFLPLEDHIALTQDEYEALQGFTRFQQV
ncbi:hypothetical protein INT43_005586 [Umbelopsis isabellina]|uniref:C2H2-type domain-containing protein n=1 Tax=Mortierella isabellina TaxID=91625 RepID=A0A8H7PLP1_MORIS|nr:hypothetical protein INT43_005586 [Umbelopsis isabellina]